MADEQTDQSLYRAAPGEADRVGQFQIAVLQNAPGHTDTTTLGEAWAATPMSDVVRLMVRHGVTPQMLLHHLEADAEPADPGGPLPAGPPTAPAADHVTLRPSQPDLRQP